MKLPEIDRSGAYVDNLFEALGVNTNTSKQGGIPFGVKVPRCWRITRCRVLL